MKLKGVQFKVGVRFDGEAREMVSPQNPRLAGIEIDLVDGQFIHLFAPKGNKGRGEHRWAPLSNVVSFVPDDAPKPIEAKKPEAPKK